MSNYLKIESITSHNYLQEQNVDLLFKNYQTGKNKNRKKWNKNLKSEKGIQKIKLRI